MARIIAVCRRSKKKGTKKGNVPILISKSAPTNLGVRLANDLGGPLLALSGEGE